MVDLVGIEPTTSSMPWRPQLYIQQLTSGSGNCQFLVSTCRNAVPKRILGWTLGSPAPLSRCLWQESASQSRTVPHSYKSVELGWCREPGLFPTPHVFSSTYKLERLDLIKELNLMLALSQGRWARLLLIILNFRFGSGTFRLTSTH